MKNAFEYEAELAALREELADAMAGAKSAMAGKDELRHDRGDLQQRLAAAEQRNKDFLEIMRSVRLNANPRLFSIGQLARIDTLLTSPVDTGAL